MNVPRVRAMFMQDTRGKGLGIGFRVRVRFNFSISISIRLRVSMRIRFRLGVRCTTRGGQTEVGRCDTSYLEMSESARTCIREKIGIGVQG